MVDEEKEMAMFFKRFNKFMKMNNNEFIRFQKRDMDQGKEKDPIMCYECKKSDHIKFDYPTWKKNDAKKGKKKAMVAT